MFDENIDSIVTDVKTDEEWWLEHTKHNGVLLSKYEVKKSPEK